MFEKKLATKLWNFSHPEVQTFPLRYAYFFPGHGTLGFPSGVELVRFTNSGTEANTMALAAAVALPGPKKILTFTNGHGGTLSFPSTLHEVNTNLPNDFVLAPYNDIAGTQVVVSSLPKHSLAAITVELVQRNGGCIPGDPYLLRFLNKLAKELGAHFIVDEVMTSRLAYHGLSFELGLPPGLVTLGKWIGGGMTFGAFGGPRDGLMSMFNSQRVMLKHSGTFNNNVMTMAAGCAGMDVYEMRCAGVKRSRRQTSDHPSISPHEIRNQPNNTYFCRDTSKIKRPRVTTHRCYECSPRHGRRVSFCSREEFYVGVWSRQPDEYPFLGYV